MDRVPRGIDRHLQRIMGNVTNSSDQNRSGHYAFGATRSAEPDVDSAPGHLEDPMLLDAGLSGFESSQQSSMELSSVKEPDSYTFEPSRQPPTTASTVPDRGLYSFNPTRQVFAAASGPARLSLVPQNIYSRQDSEPRVLTNADNHFRFAQNLRHGQSMHRAPLQSSVNNHDRPDKSQSPLTQLANNMILQRRMPQAGPEQANIYKGPTINRLSRLQPRRQEATPPFNLSGFALASNNENQASSSPPTAHPSSPTARFSLRRANNRAAHSSNVVEEDEHEFVDTYDERADPPETPQRQTTTSMHTASKRMPQSLALGHAPPMAHGIQLISPHELPDRFRHVFPYELFNAAQSKCFAPIYKTNDNVVVSAPTGSGKTALLELAICKLVESHPSGQFKIVYQAPTKSLCSERMRDWQKKFSHLNLVCAELTGDTGYAESNRVGAASIIVTTPEKWDSITRKWKDYSKLLQLVKLFLIDEVHILKDTRGATLEAVVSRMKTSGANVRFVALSATVPNSQDIAIWLGKDHTNDHIPAHRETFGEDFRPVKLQKHVYGYEGGQNDFAFEKILDGKLSNLIQKHSHKKPIMVFCFTRKSCESTAAMLAEWWNRQKPRDRAWPAPIHIPNVGGKELRDLVGSGVAFHHAGLEPADRQAIETAFLKGDVSVICCTSTLAVGVNLPCHLVVLKGTVCFQDGKMCEYSDLEVMQMLGRAGRPQFDDSAVAIILTRKENEIRYQKMISGQDILESTLHLNLIEHLNSEIGLGTIRDLYTAKKWLMGTFLSVRMRQNPDYYKLEGVAPSRDTDQRLELVCERDIKLLEDHELVKYEGDRLSGTEYGQAMSRYMVQFETMKLLLSLPYAATIGQILDLSSQAAEFKDLRMKPKERPPLREFNKSSSIKFPIKDNISTTAHKISVMIQVQLGGIDMPTDKEFNMIRRQFAMEKCVIFERVQRLVRCIVDCKAYQCDAIGTRHALDLARSLSAEFWENSNLQLRQIPQIGPVAHRKLIQSGINSIEKLGSADTGKIEQVLGKNPPFGKKTTDLAATFPRLRVTSAIAGKTILKSGTSPRINVKVELGFMNPNIPVWNGHRPSVTFMAETSKGVLVHFWRGNISKLDKGLEIKFNADLDAPEDTIKCHLACDELVGTVVDCSLFPKFPASAFTPQALKQSAISAQSKNPNDVGADEFGTDEIEDDVLLAATENAEIPRLDSELVDSDGFVDIDDLGDLQANASCKSGQNEVPYSFQMENGRWTCAHACRGGKIMKNGQICKHKCCKDGVERRPSRRVRTKSSTGTGELLPSSNTQKKDTKTAKVAKKGKVATRNVGCRATDIVGLANRNQEPGLSQSELKLKQQYRSEEEEVEVVDLADVISPPSYSKVAPREYRKLHNLHASVQKTNTFVRLPNQKSQYSYASGNEPDPPFMRNSKDDNDPFDLEVSDEDLPSPSRLFTIQKEHYDDPFESGNVYFEDAPVSSAMDKSLESLEAGMLEMVEPVPFRAPTPKVDSSFANGVFDFDAFEESRATPGSPDLYSSPLRSPTQKRERSRSPPLRHAKRRQISESPEPDRSNKLIRQKQGSSSSDVPVVENRGIKIQNPVENSNTTSGSNDKDDPHPKTESKSTQHSVPDWVNDFDADLIGSLIGVVDFVE